MVMSLSGIPFIALKPAPTGKAGRKSSQTPLTVYLLRVRSIVLITLLAIGLTDCTDRHPAYSDYDIAIPMIVRPADSLLIGEYELDEFSYSLVDRTKAYPDDPILLTIRANRSFQLTNLPDMVISSTGKPVKRQFYNALGSWSVPADTSFSGSILFRFEAGDLFPTSVTVSYPLRYRSKQPAIWMPVGSPNIHQKLLFVKKT
jgi:hypothetical protein